MNEISLGKQDICGLVITYKALSSEYFSFKYKQSKGKQAKRLFAKISSDENETRLLYKKYYDGIEDGYSKDDLRIIEAFYVSLLDENIIPFDKTEWKKDTSELSSYEDAFELFSKKCDAFHNFLSEMYNNSADDDIKKMINTFIAKEQSYKTSIKLIIDKLLSEEND